MSIHGSLKARKIKLRSVLKRHERLAKAIREQKWLEGMSVYGLPKYNPPKFKFGIKEEKTTTTLGKVNLLEQHRLAKEKTEQEKKQRKIKKETTGRK